MRPFLKDTKKRRQLMLIIIGIILIGVVFSIFFSSKQETYLGYMEGDYRYISAYYTGTVKQLAVRRGTWVQKGDLLFSLDQQPESDQLEQANKQVTQSEAKIREQQANVAITQVTLKRQKAIWLQGLLDKQSVDVAQSNYDEAVAQLQQAQQALNVSRAAFVQSQWSVSQKQITSPITAFVFDTYYLPGELVPANHSIVSLIAPKDVYVIFYIPEEKLSRLKLGQTIQINCDSCKQSISAKINYISPDAEYMPPVVYSDDTREKLLYRIEARPDLKSILTLLRPGQPVKVKLYDHA